MKVYVYRASDGSVVGFIDKQSDSMVIARHFVFLGVEERDIKPEKKLVTKEVGIIGAVIGQEGEVYKITLPTPLPPKARNPRVLYDVEE
jgi:hypothetical protein